MKLIQNTGANRLVDYVRPTLSRHARLDIASPSISLFAFAELMRELQAVSECRLILPPDMPPTTLLGTPADRPSRNRLNARWLAASFLKWLSDRATLRYSNGPVPQGAIVIRNPATGEQNAVLGSLAFTTDGLGIAPGNPMNLIQASESPEEAEAIARWFDAQWNTMSPENPGPDSFRNALKALAAITPRR